MIRNALFGLCLCILSACGRDAFIAESIQLKVDFSKQLVMVAFEPTASYQIPASAQIKFEAGLREHSILYTHYQESPAWNEIGIITTAAETFDSEFWHPQEMRKFPNGSKLPRSVRKLPLLYLSQERDGLSVKSLYQSNPDLVTGGAILSSEFDSLPKNFLGTQHFSATNGELRATISVAGKTDKSLGGLYFIANFGLNPFEPVSRDGPTQTLSLWADGPMVIVHKGDRPFVFDDLPTRLLNLAQQLLNLAGSDGL